MKFVIVTGMSGAGKTTVLKFLEDLNFFCVDNLPPALITKFAELCYEKGSEIERVAIGIDIRGGRLFEDFFKGLEELESSGFENEILFLDASDATLIKRFKETRREHPLSKGGSLEDGISKERSILEDIKSKSTYIIDTTNILTRELKEQITRIFIKKVSFRSLMISVCSFGFKYGIPIDSDLVFDVRFLPNPFYVSDLKELTGMDKPVKDYVFSFPEADEFMDKLLDMLEFLLPHYISEGKNSLVISIGCTGGKHRSVCIAEAIYNALIERGHYAIIKHNDIEKDRRAKR
ncbi:MAG: RNase adapter RapZ [Firmicutes bacterium]|nr:RNase adapter RapZ [Bacillota bacterium]